MSLLNEVLVVFKKELLDHIRDRRTLITAIILPLFTFPALFGIMGYLSNPASNPSPVLVVDRDQSELSTSLVNVLLKTKGLSLSSSSKTDLKEAVEGGQYDVSLEIPEGFTSVIFRGDQANLTLYYDPANIRAQQALSIITGVAASLSQQVAVKRLASKGVTEADINPVKIEQNTVRKTVSFSQVFFANMFPSFVLYFSFLGGFYFIVDTIAGEKERRSIEALLTLPPSRSTLFMGKYAAAFLVSMTTAALGLVTTWLSLRYSSFERGREVVAPTEVAIPIEVLFPILLILVLSTLSLTALGFAITLFAKNVREAQQYLSPIFFIVFLPLYFVWSLPPSLISQYTIIPFLGYTILMRDIILGQITVIEAITSIGVNIIALLASLWLSIRLIHAENVVLRAT